MERFRVVILRSSAMPYGRAKYEHILIAVRGIFASKPKTSSIVPKPRGSEIA